MCNKVKSIIVVWVITSIVISGCVCPVLQSRTSCPKDPLEFTEKYGIISQDQTWSGNILVTGDILVDEGVTLTILPAAQILVRANTDKDNLFGHNECGGIAEFDMLQGINNKWEDKCGLLIGEPFRDEANHISIRIMGTLHAVGEPDNRIVIKSDA